MREIKNHFKYLFLAVLLSATVLVWYAVFAESRSGLTVAFLDVGQGDAIFIETDTGQQILIDGGFNKKVLEGLSKVMPFYDRSIDVVMATHPDGDHIGGLPEILNRYKVDLVIESGVESDTAVSQAFENLIEEKNIKKVLARRGLKLVLSDNAYLLILFPIGNVSKWDTNDASIIAKLVYGKTSYLFTGDSPQKIEKYLVSAGKENLDVDILKVGHHGSKTSSSESFIGYTNPEYAVISSGEGNRYGHPHKEVLDLLQKFDVKVLRTDESGIIKTQSDGEQVFLKK